MDPWCFARQLSFMVLVLLMAYMTVAWMKKSRLEPWTSRDADDAVPTDVYTADASGVVTLAYFTSANVTSYASVDYSYNTFDEPVDVQPTVDYSYNGLKVQYHDPIDVIEAKSQTGTLTMDRDGNIVLMPWSDVSSNFLYYDPGAYMYGNNIYVPSYEDAVFLSQNISTPLYRT
jgi:hypothetical protein